MARFRQRLATAICIPIVSLAGHFTSKRVLELCSAWLAHPHRFTYTFFKFLLLEALDYELAFDVKFDMSKADRILYGESAMTHAMVFTGVHLDENGKPVKWRVENSWGSDNGGACHEP
ncbi:peptidase C1-like family-domain-containing protein [Gongronella butleri]|nr:peptidase C1-like family-domain-containing protein [Gongronella butleri]